MIKVYLTWTTEQNRVYDLCVSVCLCVFLLFDTPIRGKSNLWFRFDRRNSILSNYCYLYMYILIMNFDDWRTDNEISRAS